MYSASRLKIYSSCERKYYHSYIQKTERPEPTHSLLLGRAVHTSIEAGYKGGNPFDVYNAEWSNAIALLTSWDSQKMNKAYIDGLDILQKYDFTKRTPKEIEYPFKLPFPNPDSELIMQGYIDQLYDGMVVDLKTSMRKPTKIALNNDIQFIIYNWVYKTIFGEEPVMIWHHLRTGQDVIADVRGEEKLKTVIDLVHKLDTHSGGTDIEAYPQNKRYMCRFCDFYSHCFVVERGEPDGSDSQDSSI